VYVFTSEKMILLPLIWKQNFQHTILCSSQISMMRGRCEKS